MANGGLSPAPCLPASFPYSVPKVACMTKREILLYIVVPLNVLILLLLYYWWL